MVGMGVHVQGFYVNLGTENSLSIVTVTANILRKALRMGLLPGRSMHWGDKQIRKSNKG